MEREKFIFAFRKAFLFLSLINSVFCSANTGTLKWRNNLDGQGFIYDSREAAASAGRATHAKYSDKSFSRIISQNKNQVVYEYYGPTYDAERQPWDYIIVYPFLPCIDPDPAVCPFVSNEPIIEFMEDFWPGNCGQTTVTIEQPPYSGPFYFDGIDGPANESRLEYHAYYANQPVLDINGVCTNHSRRVNVRRLRSYECPEYQLPEDAFFSPATWGDKCTSRASPNLLVIGKPLTCTGANEGNPCNVSTGDKIENETDYDDGWLSFSRTYHSLGATHASEFAPNIGKKWSHSFSAHLVINETNTDLLYGYVRSNGYHEPMNGQAGGPYFSDTNTKSKSRIDKICFGNDQSEQICEWKLQHSGGLDYFDLNGKLIRRINTNGRKLALMYANQQLTTVIDESDRKLQFIYYLSGIHTGKLKKIIRPDNLEIIYQYDENNNLDQVNYPDNTSINYHYEHTNFINHLTGITDRRGGARSVYEYDPITAQAIKTVPVGGIGERIFSYQTLKTIVTDSNTNNREYIFDSPDKTHLVEIKDICTDVDCIDGIRFNKWNGNNLEQVNDNELITEYGGFDNLGRPTYRIEGKGTNDARRIDMIYEIGFSNLIKKTIEHSIINSHSNTDNSQIDFSLPCDFAIDKCRVTDSTYDQYGNLTSRTISGWRMPSDSETEPQAISQTTSWVYNGPYNQLSQINGPRTDINDVTTLEYYNDDASQGFNRGRLKKITLANGLVQTNNIQYNAVGKILSETGLNSEIRTYSYYPGNDRLQSMTITQGNDSQTTNFTYIATGEIESITTAAGTSDALTTSFNYDAAKQIINIMDNHGNFIQYGYDSEGNQTSESIHDDTGELQRALTKTYDRFNRLNVTTQNYGNSDMDYANDGTLDQISDGKGFVTDYSYDGLRRMIRSVEDFGSLDVKTEYVYDVADRIVKVIDPNNHETSYVYDDLGNLRALNSPDTGRTTYQYDAVGNMTSMINAHGVTINYTYDALNRLTDIQYPNTELNVSYTYDINPSTNLTCTNGNGQLCMVTDSSGINEYAYDYLGNIIQRQTNYQGQIFLSEASYNDNSTKTSYTTATGSQLYYELDDLHRIKKIIYGNKALLSNVRYRADGQVSSLIFANQYQQSTVFDNDSGLPVNYNYAVTNSTIVPMLPMWALLTLVCVIGFFLRPDNTAKAGALLLICVITTTFAMPTGVETLSYDANGNIDSKSFNGNNQVFTYDALNRLTNETGDISTDSYTYNESGNRLSLNTKNFTIDTNSNRITDIDQTNIGYDATGNMISDGTHIYTYDDAGRLLQVEDINNTLIATYTYNFQNQRTSKTNAITGITTFYHYDFDGLLVEETNTLGQSQIIYVYHNGIPVSAILKADGFYNSNNQDITLSIVTDHLGTPRLAMDETQTTVWTWESSAFGALSANTDPDNNGSQIVLNLRFPGQYYDQESGLHYNWNRYYDPSIGRYITSDPIGLAGGVNTYGYVGSNPINIYDPLGLLSRTRAASISGGTFGAKLGFGIGTGILPFIFGNDIFGTECNSITDECSNTTSTVTEFDIGIEMIGAGSNIGSAFGASQAVPSAASSLVVGVTGFLGGFEIGRLFNKTWSYFSNCQSSFGTWLYDVNEYLEELNNR